jgi:hypothetical protein
MRELEDKIARLKLQAEYLLNRLQRLAYGSPQAMETRKDLEATVKRLTVLMDERARLLFELGLATKI